MGVTPASEYLTTQEAARLAGITPATLRSYAHDGYAPKPVWPRRGLYNRREIEAWIKNRPGRGRRTDLHKTVEL